MIVMLTKKLDREYKPICPVPLASAFDNAIKRLEIQYIRIEYNYVEMQVSSIITMEDTFFIFETLTSRFITRLRTVKSIEHFSFIRKCVYVGAHISIQFY